MLETEKLETILNRQLSWIVAADSRLSLLLPLSTAMLGSLAAYAPRPSDWNLSCGISAAFAIFFLCLGIVCCAFAFFPRTSGTKGSIIYFEGINSRNLDQYQAHLASCKMEDYNSDLVQQCYINASIASAKFAWVKRGMASLFTSAIPWAFTIYQFFGLRHGHI